MCPKKLESGGTSLFEDQDDSNQRRFVFVRSTEVYPLICECFVYSLNCSGDVGFIQDNGPSSPPIAFFFAAAAFRVSFRKCLHIRKQTHKYMNCVSRCKGGVQVDVLREAAANAAHFTQLHIMAAAHRRPY